MTLNELELEVKESRQALKAQGSLPEAIRQVMEENRGLRRQIEQLQEKLAVNIRADLRRAAVERDGIRYLVAEVPLDDPKVMKNLIFQLDQELSPAVIVLGNIADGKPTLSVTVSKSTAESGVWHAGQMVRDLATHIQGGGGGQPFFATAGGKDTSGLPVALKAARTMLGMA